MNGIIVSILVLQTCILNVHSGTNLPSYSSARKIRNKRSIRQRAFNRACTAHTCQNLKCRNEVGWYLYGSDWGCCGNYDGCCTWASAVCYYHDAMCKCCDYGWLICGPDCKQDSECFESFEEKTNKMYEENSLHLRTYKPEFIKNNKNSDNSYLANIKKKSTIFKEINAILQRDKTEKRKFRFPKYVKKYSKPRRPSSNNIIAENVLKDELLMGDQPAHTTRDDLDSGSGDNSE